MPLQRFSVLQGHYFSIFGKINYANTSIYSKYGSFALTIKR